MQRLEESRIRRPNAPRREGAAAALARVTGAARGSKRPMG
eukprot:COSAG06_NODE_35294_length_461_cov_43.314917_1_plen_40_part_00